MSITHLLDETITAERKQQVGNSDKYALSTVTSVQAFSQPATDDKRLLEEGNYGKQWEFFIDANRDIQEGDRLRDADGVEYRVLAGGRTKRSQGSIEYQKIIAEETA